ncbi:hypothetical protein SLE2022_041220 [Rubroshorea leprosula]
MASSSEFSSILSILESSDDPNRIHTLVSDYLRPFANLLNPKKPSKKKDQSEASAVRSLAKQFLNFINKSLSILPRRLSKQNPDGAALFPLFDTYRLCLDCLELVSSQLACGAHEVQSQRVRLLYCLEAWGKYAEAESEGFLVLERLRRGHDLEGKLLPRADSRGGPGDADFGKVLVDAVATIVRCVAMRQSRDSGDYRRVLDLVVEVRPWFRVLDANAYDKLNRVLVTYLGKCTLFLVGEMKSFDGDLVRTFCIASLAEYANSPIKDQIYKFSRRICSSLFSQQGSGSSILVDILIRVLDFIAGKCKVDLENGGVEFVELVAYCAIKCRTAGAIFCSTLARHLKGLLDDFHQTATPFHLILWLYATGLGFTEQDAKSKADDFSSSISAEHESAIRLLSLDGDKLQDLVSLLHLLESYFSIYQKGTSKPSAVEYKNPVSRMCLEFNSKSQASTTGLEKDRKAYLLMYLRAMQFLCQPLAEQVNSEKKQIVAEIESTSVPSKLRGIQDAFYQFCDTFLYHYRFLSKTERDEFDDMPILGVFMAGITLSVCTKFKMQENEHFIKQIISSEWVQPQGLKYLSASLYNIGVLLYRNKQIKEASEMLKLCYRTSWACVELLCRLFVDKEKGLNDQLKEDAISNFITEACTRSVSYFEVLHQCSDAKVENRILESLEYWSAAEKLLKGMPSPIPLVKQWVKMQCKLHINVDLEDSSPSLYSSLSSSAKVSKSAICTIVEQELLAYEEMYPRYPDFCQRMQIKTIDFLLQHMYVTKESSFHKSRILIRKGRALRANGIESLKDCILCLSEAISIMKKICGKTCMSGAALCHQLAAAYCLRALCMQEAEPDSKQISQDINAALDLWLSISSTDHCSVDDEFSLVLRNTAVLLYNVVDLLSIKGCTEFHNDIYELIIRFYKLKNVPLQKCVATLWECRRLNHALCVSPINEAFITKLSEHCGENSKLIDFWVQCLGSSKPLLIGLKQNISFFFNNFTHASNNPRRDIHSGASIKDVKEVVSELISNDPVPSRSAFLAGCLCHDLSERLIANGRLFEALSYAEKAHGLRTQLFREKFTYTVEKQIEEHNGTGEVAQKVITCSPKSLQVLKSVACEVWPFETSSWDPVDFNLSAWNVLHCYLESILQVGIIHEMAGNGVEAETMLSWGKSISCSLSLALFRAAFSSVLGKLYRKKQLWDLAEKELQSARQVLADKSINFTCLKCRLMLEVNVDQQLGDLFRNLFDCSKGSNLRQRLSQAEDLYRNALEKLNHSEWKNSISCFDKESATHIAADQSDTMDIGKPRKTKKLPKSALKEKILISQCSSRLTRSKYRSSQNQTTSGAVEAQVGLSEHSKSDTVLGDAPIENELLLEGRDHMDGREDEVACICNKLKCWRCLPLEVMKSGFLSSYINVKWEFARRRLSVRVLGGIGKCLGFCGQSHETHEVILQSISVLVSRNPISQSYSTVHITFLLDLIGKEFSGDAFAIERAAILYIMSWFSLKTFHSKDTRILFCDLAHVQLSKIVFWLKLAFVLSREVPILFQKVSRLLAAMYLLSANSKQFSLPSSCKVLSESYWASYFHQASLGTHLNYQFFSIGGRVKTQHSINPEGSYPASSTCSSTEKSTLFRLAPDSTEDLEQFVIKFFEDLPCTSIICISLLGGSYANLVKELLLYHSCPHAWMLLSRFNSKNQPLVVLVPVGSVLEDNDDSSSDSWELLESLNSSKHWSCPWGSTVVDDVAPAFKEILEENYLSSNFPSEDTKKNRSLWWMRRTKLDHRLGKLLSKLEDSWLGPWRYMLLGEYLNCKNLDLVHKKLMRDLKSKCKMDVNESLLKLFLGGAKEGFEQANLPQLCLKKGCFVGPDEHFGEESCELSKSTDKVSRLPFQLIQDAVNRLDEEDNPMREPIILVLDCDVQMLPWESIPTLRNQEVYRMPSVGSISVMLDRICLYQEQVDKMVAAFPLIDPMDAFFLLNPSGDLSSTQVEFEKWFKDQNFEGRAGSVPTTEELATALKSHDLFLYFGHGSGSQYIPRHEIQKLDNCAATLLMGCSSGTLSLNGCYIPQGTPLSYLLAGSPVIVANLWEVTDKDIDRFAKAMLDAWLRARSDIANPSQCNVLQKEFEGMHISGRKGNSKKRVPLKELPETHNDSSKNTFDHRPKIGSFMGQAREACTLPFLIGASPVCYGVPTGIWRKKDL